MRLGNHPTLLRELEKQMVISSFVLVISGCELPAIY